MEKKELSAVRKKTENPLVSGLEQGDVGGVQPPDLLGKDEVTSSNLVSSSTEYHPFFEFIERRVVAFDRAAAPNQAAGRAK